MQGQVQMLHVGSQTGVGIMTRDKHPLNVFLQLDLIFHFKNTAFCPKLALKRDKDMISLMSYTNQRHENVHPWPQEAPQQVT